MSAKLHPITISAVCHPIVPIIVVAVGAATNIPSEAAAVPRPKMKLLRSALHNLAQGADHDWKRGRPGACPDQNAGQDKCRRIGRHPTQGKSDTCAYCAKGENPRRSKPVCNRPGDGLGKSPSEKLDSDGKREYLATPAKVLRHGGQKNAKGGGKSKAQKGHHAPSQNGRPKAWCLLFICLHYCPLSLFETLPDTLSLN